MADNKDPMKRRNFLGKIAGGSVAAMGGLVAFMGVGFLYPLEKRKPKPLFICFENDIPDGKPFPITDLTGRTVFLIRGKDSELLAVSTVCTHLGCAVFYRSEDQIFDCPCHQGVFDIEGNPVSGPPERPLDRYPVEVRGGKVFIEFS